LSSAKRFARALRSTEGALQATSMHPQLYVHSCWCARRMPARVCHPTAPPAQLSSAHASTSTDQHTCMLHPLASCIRACSSMQQAQLHCRPSGSTAGRQCRAELCRAACRTSSSSSSTVMGCAASSSPASFSSSPSSPSSACMTYQQAAGGGRARGSPLTAAGRGVVAQHDKHARLVRRHVSSGHAPGCMAVKDESHAPPGPLRRMLDSVSALAPRHRRRHRPASARLDITRGKQVTITSQQCGRQRWSRRAGDNQKSAQNIKGQHGTSDGSWTTTHRALVIYALVALLIFLFLIVLAVCFKVTQRVQSRNEHCRRAHTGVCQSDGRMLGWTWRGMEF